MKTLLNMNFTVDKQNKKVVVEREFAAPLTKVWAAWTEPQLLDQWWAPKPWKAQTKEMKFETGGHWLYAMVGPDGTEHWAKAEYKTVQPKTNFSGVDSFCDSNGNINTSFPQSQWNVSFTENSGLTTVHIQVTYSSVEALEKTMEMGFKEGFTMALQNLDEIFAAL